MVVISLVGWQKLVKFFLFSNPFYGGVFWIGGVWRSTQISWRSKLLEGLVRVATELASTSAPSQLPSVLHDAAHGAHGGQSVLRSPVVMQSQCQ